MTYCNIIDLDIHSMFNLSCQVIRMLFNILHKLIWQESWCIICPYIRTDVTTYFSTCFWSGYGTCNTDLRHVNLFPRPLSLSLSFFSYYYFIFLHYTVMNSLFFVKYFLYIWSLSGVRRSERLFHRLWKSCRQVVSLCR